MNRTRNVCAILALCLCLFVATAVPAAAATFEPYFDRAAFLAAVGGSPSTQDFEAFEVGTVLTSLPGVTFTSPNTSMEGFVPIQIVSGLAASPTRALGGGYVSGSPGTRQIIEMIISPGVNAVGFFLTGLNPYASSATVMIEFSDETTEWIEVGDGDFDESTPEFFGVTSDTHILNVTITSGAVSGDVDVLSFDEFGLDDLILSDVLAEGDLTPPVCTGHPIDMDGPLAIAGRVTDNGETDSGIGSVALDPNSENLVLDMGGDFESGAPGVDFFVYAGDPNEPGMGTVVATDLAGNRCTLAVNLKEVGAGPTHNEVLCSGAGILFEVSNDSSTDPGPEACSSNLPGPGDPNFPPGYEPSDPNDPFPCRVLTIDSPISGPTEMVYKKDGTFEPRLRLLFSHFDGVGFPPFTDVTEEVRQIADINPDPTRTKGTGSWSPVKVACAVQSELCNGIDDDHDGLIDEGLPVGGPPVDFDGDGYCLCVPAGAPGDCQESPDCNDQVASIHPGAAEVCNGMDDNCDGVIDEGNPGGGASCEVPGKLGVCAEGTTRCDNARLECDQTNFPTAEVCDGVDNDCNGATDENYVFGGYLPPVDPSGQSIFQRRGTIPFKFRLTSCSGAVVSTAVARISVFFYANATVGTELEDVASAGQANTDDLYRFSAGDGQYIYNLNAKLFAAKTSYLVRTTLDDGSTHDVIISFK